jgi:hypothetical protein
MVFICSEFTSMSCDEKLCFITRGNPELNRLYKAIYLVNSQTSFNTANCSQGDRFASDVLHSFCSTAQGLWSDLS